MLIKACLSGIAIYFMSPFKMPKKVVYKLDSIRRKFLWEGRGDKKRLHLVKWSQVIKPKYTWGFGSWQFGNQEHGFIG